MDGDQLYVCGSRAVVREGEGYVVVCATCGSKKHLCATLARAIAHCTDTSDRTCSVCGNDALVLQ